MSGIAKTPKPPYYAAIFTSKRTENDNGYNKMAEKMVELAAKQEGFLGVESVREKGLGITISYWNSLEAIHHWKQHAVHQAAQRKGRDEWYRTYAVRICKVESESVFNI
ncbi:antibiotic biosynthesis monooxygenase [Virgibacillus salarius]|uniref:antibiotic biosynthesis monooxygenase family protein n=1 Tax=Virgibacillus salarius TaxID=447199 RepID=UPI000419B16B|nr:MULTISPECIES: antibiotic biosynthesis monooxygenase [Bacillaceae]WBX81618.1 antibiotic biosynthesis monooxygenase [Virgibacillus salarius]